jgi:hypothetical protein
MNHLKQHDHYPRKLETCQTFPWFSGGSMADETNYLRLAFFFAKYEDQLQFKKQSLMFNVSSERP